MGLTLQVGAEPIAGYRLEAALGKGGFGEVWRATGPGGFSVALKFVQLNAPAGPVEMRSIDIIKGINHPHLLSTFGSWQIDGYLVIAMELAERRDSGAGGVRVLLGGCEGPGLS